jgi:NADPH:quinone reductase-like Zn-dependent oxidoreductase
MRQVWIPRKGRPDVLEVREAPDPEPGPGQVRVRVQAAGVNFADVMARMGLYLDAPPLPAVVGYEVSGTVDALGAGVTGVAEGARVTALTRFGGYSSAVIVPEAQAIPIPDALSFEKAAAIPVNYLTAWLMLVWHGNLRQGDRVLVHAVAGGVGQAAVQICKWRGAEVIGTASGSKHERLKAMGVAHCIDYTKQDFEAEVARITGGKGVDLALDAVGGKSFKKSYRSLAPLGKLFMFGVSSIAPGDKRSIFAALRTLAALPKFKTIPLMQENRGVVGVNLGHLWDQQAKIQAMLTDIMALIRDGVLDPEVDKVFPFDRAGEAHGYIQARKNFGKVLICP